MTDVSVEFAAQTRNARRKQRTHEQIRTAAAALLIEKGYEALTIQDITDRVDLARATFYIHFRDKDDAIWSVVQDQFDALNAAILQARTTAPDEGSLQKLLQIFQYAEQNRALLRVMLGERGHIRLLRRLTNYLAQIIQRDLDAGLTPLPAGVPIAFAAQFLAGATVQILTWWLEQPNDYTSEQIVALFFALEVQSR
jgi:AcrR family transcriptional regulator